MEELQYCPVCKSEKMESWLECKDHFLTGEMFTIVNCIDCGFRFTNPRPEPGNLGTYYQSPEYISHSNSRKGLFNSLYQKIRKYTIRKKYEMISSYTGNTRILDIGCATGEFLAYMKEKGWNTLGIEPDANARKQARDIRGLEVFDEGQLEKLADSSFGVITMWHVLEHVSDLRERMECLCRLLVPGGLLIVAVPNSDSHDAGMYGECWAGFDVPRHLYHFTPATMQRLLSSFGFILVKTVPMKFDAFYVSLLSEKYKHGKMLWLNGFLNGFRSNSRARRDGNYSSLIFIAKKEIRN